MGPVEQRTTRQERKQRIEDAATELFARRGYAATTMDEIAASAGFTKPMVYRDFESKRELCISLLRRHREELVNAALDAYDPEDEDRPGQLRKMFAAWFDHAHSSPDAVRLVFLPIFGDPEIARVQEDLHDRQRATQTSLLREFASGHDPAETEPLAELLRVSLGGLALWWLDHPETPGDVLVEIMVRMSAGLIGEGPASKA